MTFGKSALQYLFVLAAVVALLASNEGVVGQTFTLTITTNGTTETFTQEPTTYTHTMEIHSLTQPTAPSVEPTPADPAMIIMLLMGLVIGVLAILLLILFAKLREKNPSRNRETESTGREDS
jgi:capsular polysaccharide biosynthesis protein